MILAPEDIRMIASAVVDELADRGLVATAPQTRDRVLNADQVADLLGRRVDWVYAHAGELGGFRMGNGTKARLGFDEQAIARWKHAQAITPPVQPATPRRPTRRRGSAAPGLIDYEDHR